MVRLRGGGDDVVVAGRVAGDPSVPCLGVVPLAGVRGGVSLFGCGELVHSRSLRLPVVLFPCCAAPVRA